MSKFVNTIDELGDEAVAISILTKSITEFNDNTITSVGGFAFYQCPSLESLDLPNVLTVGSSAFNGSSSLKKADFLNLNHISSYAFSKCSALDTLILRSNTMCTLETHYGLDNTAIRNKNGYIYVPRALLSDDDETMDYRRATNWSEFATQFRALEDYTVDGTTTGELDSTKI